MVLHRTPGIVNFTNFAENIAINILEAEGWDKHCKHIPVFINTLKSAH